MFGKVKDAEKFHEMKLSFSREKRKRKEVLKRRMKMVEMQKRGSQGFIAEVEGENVLRGQGEKIPDATDFEDYAQVMIELEPNKTISEQALEIVFEKTIAIARTMDCSILKIVLVRPELAFVEESRSILTRIGFSEIGKNYSFELDGTIAENLIDESFEFTRLTADKLTLEYCTQIADLYADLCTSDPTNPEPPMTAEKQQKRLLEEMAVSAIYVLERDRQIISIVSIQENIDIFSGEQFCNLENFIVHRDYRRQGIGNFVLDRISRIAADKGCSRVQLNSSNFRHGAHKFYEQYSGKGFQVVGSVWKIKNL